MSRQYTVVAHLPEHMGKIESYHVETVHSGPSAAAVLFIGRKLPDGWKLISDGKRYPAQHQDGRLIRATQFEACDADQKWGASIWVKEDLGPYIW